MSKTRNRKTPLTSPPEAAAADSSAATTDLRQRLRPVLSLLLFGLLSAGAALFIHTRSVRIPAMDALYHLRHASLYLSHSLFMQEFPWAAFSVIGRYAADIWYGFHLLLIPFTFLDGPILQAKAAGVFLLVCSMLLFHFTARRSRLAYPYLWPFVLLGSFTWRLSQTRPNIVSIGLLAALFACLVNGGVWGVFLTGFAISWIHLSFFWMAMVVGGVVFLVKARTEKTWEWRKLAALCAGLLAGWLLRPNPVGAAKILYVQLVRLMQVRSEGTPLPWGNELYPMNPERFFSEYGLLAMLWLSGAVVSVLILLRRGKLPPQPRTLLWSSLALSLPFFVITLAVSERILDLWAPFAVLSIAVGFSLFIQSAGSKEPARAKKAAPRPSSTRARQLAPIGICVLLFALISILSLRTYQAKLGICGHPDRLKYVGAWLRENAAPKTIVFHTNWGDFSELFYWNPDNYYVGGMDPIFQYEYDHSLYWKAYHLLQREAVQQTWGAQTPGQAPPEDTYTVITRDYRAKYFFVSIVEAPELYEYTKSDPSYLVGFDNSWQAIYRLTDAAGNP